MNNQRRQIKAYRKLGQPEIDLMNKIKAAGVALGYLVEQLHENDDTDKRWVLSVRLIFKRD